VQYVLGRGGGLGPGKEIEVALNAACPVRAAQYVRTRRMRHWADCRCNQTVPASAGVAAINADTARPLHRKRGRIPNTGCLWMRDRYSGKRCLIARALFVPRGGDSALFSSNQLIAKEQPKPPNPLLRGSRDDPWTNLPSSHMSGRALPVGSSPGTSEKCDDSSEFLLSHYASGRTLVRRIRIQDYQFASSDLSWDLNKGMCSAGQDRKNISSKKF